MKSVGIIGGGVIGLCCAYYLQKEGYETTVIDQGDLNHGCSFINAGMIVPSHVVPLAAPGVVSKSFHWMFRFDSPFSIHPRFDKDMLRWAWLFYRSATKKNVHHGIPYLRDISLLSKSLYLEFASEAPFDFDFQEKGLLMLYQTSEAEKEETETARLAHKAGISAEILTASEVQQLEPELEVSVKGGIYFRGDAHLNPNRFMKGMIRHLKNKGVTFLSQTQVTGFEKRSGKVVRIKSDNSEYPFNEIVIACGAWSNLLLKKLNISLHLQGGKGYSFNFGNMEKNIHIPSLLTEGKVAVTPMGNILRVSGTMEIGGNPAAIHQQRIRGIMNTLHHFYPGIKNIEPVEENISSGRRPCSPDGLPFIGKLNGLYNVTVATGHGMMGMSLGPATGKLVSELITGKKLSMDINSFRIERFGIKKQG